MNSFTFNQIELSYDVLCGLFEDMMSDTVEAKNKRKKLRQIAKQLPYRKLTVFKPES